MIYAKTTFMVSWILSKHFNKYLKTTFMVYNYYEGNYKPLAKTKIKPIIFSNLYTVFVFFLNFYILFNFPLS